MAHIGGANVRKNGTSKSLSIAFTEKGALPIVNAVLNLWSKQPDPSCPEPDQNKSNPNIGKERILKMDHPYIDFEDTTNDSTNPGEELRRRNLTIAVGLAIKANPPSRDNIQIIVEPPLSECLLELGLPEQNPYSHYGTWTDDGKGIVDFFRKSKKSELEFGTWVRKRLAGK
jgi:hypothetical protein